MLMCAAAVLYAGKTGSLARPHVSLAAVAASGRGRGLSGKALADVEQMYARDPQLVKEFALLTGKSGQALLDQIAPPKAQPLKPKVFKGPTLHTLDTYMQQLSDATEEQVRESTMPNMEAQTDAGQLKKAFNMLNTVEVNKRTAWMMINDLSQDWDKHSNYSATPWEFCAGRNLSPRQIRMCTGHLIRVAGVHSHRDLNMNAKIYDRFCTGDGHQFIDKYGSPIFLPLGSREKCAKIVTARTNVDAMLKRQVTMYREHRDRATGVVTPAKWEMQGSHSIDCSRIPEGC